MKQEIQVNLSTPNTQSTPTTPAKKWYHLNLFQKFALIFFCVVALPVVLIAFTVAYQSQLFILDNTAQFIKAVTSSMETVTQIQQKESEAVFDVVHRDFSKISKESLENLKTRLIKGNQSFVKGIEPFQGMVSEHIGQQIEQQLELAIQEELKNITREITQSIAARKDEVRQNIALHYNAFMPTIATQVTENINLVAADVHKETLHNVIPMIISLGILAVATGIIVAGQIIKPIRGMTTIAHDISTGNVGQTVPEVHSHDEIGLLSQSFHETTKYLWNIVEGAQKISEGELSNEVTPVSQKDSLGMAFKHMIDYLRDIATLAMNISNGDLSQVVTPKSESDVLGNAVYGMTLYLQRIAQVAKKVAGGDLSESSQPLSKKDFLGNAFAEMILKLRYLVAKIRTGANQLVTLSFETHSRAQEEAESVEKISLSVEETSTSMTEMAVTIEQVNARMKQLSSSVDESSSSIEQLNSSIRQIAQHGEQLATASEETSSSIQEISASLQQIADTAQHSKMLSDTAKQDAIHGRESVEKMIQSMNMIEHMVTVTADAIQLLNKRTESIETILDVIKDISDQTSLLSINASIIAKKPGNEARGLM